MKSARVKIINMATTQQRSLLTTRDYNESRVSLTTNSTRSQRLTRKRDTSNSGSRNKSRSKEQSEDNDFQSYLKQVKTTHPLQNNLEKSLERLRASQCSVGREEETSEGKATNFKRIRPSLAAQGSLEHCEKRKRQPTPVKSRKEIQKGFTQELKGERDNFQLELKVAELENELGIEKTMRIKCSDGKITLEKTVEHLKEVLSQLEIENNILIGEKKGYEDRIRELESTILQSQKDLSITKNKLNKLKETIKQNKMSELQGEVRRLMKSNQKSKNSLRVIESQKRTLLQELAKYSREAEDLNKKVQQLEIKAGRENKAWRESTREQFLSKQVQRLKKELYDSKDERYHFLQCKLMEKEEQIFHLGTDIKDLKIQVHFLKQSKEKEIKDLKTSKESELKKLRVKCSKLVNELKSMNKGKNQTNRSMPKSAQAPGRASILDRSGSRDSIQLSLSPD